MGEERGPKPSNAQWHRLMDILSVDEKMRQNEFDGGPNGKVNLDRKWSETAVVLNTLGGAQKTGEKWREAWANLKKRVKRAVVTQRTYLNGTGGGPQAPELSDVHARCYNLIDTVKVVGNTSVPSPLLMARKRNNQQMNGALQSQQVHLQQGGQAIPGPMQQAAPAYFQPSFAGHMQTGSVHQIVPGYVNPGQLQQTGYGYQQTEHLQVLPRYLQPGQVQQAQLQQAAPMNMQPGQPQHPQLQQLHLGQAQPLQQTTPGDVQLGQAQPLQQTATGNMQLGQAQPLQQTATGNLQPGQPHLAQLQQLHVSQAQPLQQTIPGNMQLGQAQPLQQTATGNLQPGQPHLAQLQQLHLSQAQPLQQTTPGNMQLGQAQPLQQTATGNLQPGQPHHAQLHKLKSHVAQEVHEFPSKAALLGPRSPSAARVFLNKDLDSSSFQEGDGRSPARKKLAFNANSPKGLSNMKSVTSTFTEMSLIHGKESEEQQPLQEVLGVMQATLAGMLDSVETLRESVEKSTKTQESLLEIFKESRKTQESLTEIVGKCTEIQQSSTNGLVQAMNDMMSFLRECFAPGKAEESSQVTKDMLAAVNALKLGVEKNTEALLVITKL